MCSCAKLKDENDVEKNWCNHLVHRFAHRITKKIRFVLYAILNIEFFVSLPFRNDILLEFKFYSTFCRQMCVCVRVLLVLNEMSNLVGFFVFNSTIPNDRKLRNVGGCFRVLFECHGAVHCMKHFIWPANLRLGQKELKIIKWT